MANMLPILLLGGAALFLMSKGGDEGDESSGNGEGDASEGEHSKECYVFINRIRDQAPEGETNVVGSFTVGSPSYSQTQRQLIKETALPECERINKFRQVDMVGAINAMSVEDLEKAEPGIQEAFEASGESIGMTLEQFMDEMKRQINELAGQVNMTILLGVKSSAQSNQRLYILSPNPAGVAAKFDAMDKDQMASEYNELMQMMGMNAIASEVDLEVESLSNSSADTVKAVKGAIGEAEITSDRSAKAAVRSPDFRRVASVTNVLKRLVS